jgi:voltage-gated potassium channel
MVALRNSRTREMFSQGRFTVLMIFLLSLFVVLPFFEHSPFAMVLLEGLFSFIMMAAIYAISHQRKSLIAACVIALPALAGRWFPQYATSPPFFVIVTVFTIIFFACIAVFIVIHVARSKQITSDTISAALCVYLLVGLTWAAMYSIIFLVDPRAFAMPALRSSEYPGIAPIRAEVFRLIYFSFATLTTTGYGDIAPATAVSRGLAVLEMILGQFYVAVIVARLVSLQILHAARSETEK